MFAIMLTLACYLGALGAAMQKRSCKTETEVNSEAVLETGSVVRVESEVVRWFEIMTRNKFPKMMRCIVQGLSWLMYRHGAVEDSQSSYGKA